LKILIDSTAMPASPLNGSHETGPAGDAVIEFRSVDYRLPLTDGFLLKDVSFSVRRGQTLMLLGRSGSGKTTCLKLINRLLTPSSGSVWVEGKPTSEWDVIPLRRGIGYAIQDVGLFPHYSVRQNVALIPRLENWEQQRISDRVTEVLKLVGLPTGEFMDRYPDQLSGGQRQRVGLARALAAEPKILLMDEPFGALDPITRAEIQQEFQKLQSTLGKTIVFVTHDVAEALILGDRIALMEQGHLKGTVTRQEFYESKDELVLEYLQAYRASHVALP
jgi:osmoprotectant transport system ATP-binding protein